MAKKQKKAPGYERRDHDVYETPAWVTEYLLDNMEFPGPVLEPAAGSGHMAAVLRERFGASNVIATDIRGLEGLDYGPIDFTASLPFDTKATRAMQMCRSIITNPPYGLPGSNLAQKFIEKALHLTAPWRGCVAMLLLYEYDATSHGGVFLHPSFHMKLVLPRRISWVGLESDVSPMQVHAWYVWQHRDKFQGRKGGARVVYPSAKVLGAQVVIGSNNELFGVLDEDA